MKNRLMHPLVTHRSVMIEHRSVERNQDATPLKSDNRK
jgi:hypothetical protein